MSRPENGRVRVLFHICGPANRTHFGPTINTMCQVMDNWPMSWNGKSRRFYIDERIQRIVEYCEERTLSFSSIRRYKPEIAPLEQRAVERGILPPDYPPGWYRVCTLPIPPELVIEDCDVLVLFCQLYSSKLKSLVEQYEAACEKAGVTCLLFVI